MELSISETSKITNLSIRTLRYYDEIDLIKPSKITDAGYRYYDEKSLEKLQEILFLKELDFSLKEIKEIVSNPQYNRKKAMENHKNLLIMKKNRIENLISLLENITNGGSSMSFKEFDMSDIQKEQKKYAEEIKERWGETEAYKESENKTSKYSKDKWANLAEEADAIFKEFSVIKNESETGEKAQALVKKWQVYITKNYYNCTKEILAGLAEMYIGDERFKNNIDKYSEGTAEFMSKAIKEYCK
jgi:DNA-binding transcriptional MerR regulator